MYVVEWEDHEGNLQQRRFKDKQDAQAEADYLKMLYDNVQVRKET